ncbi:MAG: DUF4340 domain-containing protein [Planctomycetes bacterium]|nr:DUF4340 domain-containing protein [Planctomycetota bacterium]
MRLNQILTIIFLVLLVPSVIKFATSGLDITTAEELPKLFPGYNKDVVAVVEISKPALDENGEIKKDQNGETVLDVISLAKADNKWKVMSGAYPGKLDARTSDVESKVLEPLGKIETSETAIIVKEADDATLAGFELDDKHAVTVTVGNANREPIATLLVGRAAGGADVGANATSGTYVRRPKEKVVVLTDELLNYDTKLDTWVNKTLLDIAEPKDVVKLTLKNAKGEAAFEREDGDKPWKASKQPEGTGEIREGELTSILGRARYVTAISFVDMQAGQVDHGLNTPKIELTIQTKDNKTYQLRIGNEVEGKQENYAHISNYDQVLFTIARYDVDALQKDPKDLFDPKKDDPKKEEPKKEDGKGDAPTEGNGTGNTKKDEAPQDDPKKDGE